MDLPKLGDNSMKAFFSLEATCSFLRFISRFKSTRRYRRARYKSHLNRTPTGTSTQWVYDITSIHTYTYEHGCPRIPRQTSTCGIDWLDDFQPSLANFRRVRNITLGTQSQILPVTCSDWSWQQIASFQLSTSFQVRYNPAICFDSVK